MTDNITQITEQVEEITGRKVYGRIRIITDTTYSAAIPYGEGWLLRIKPSRFAEEIKLILS